MISRMILSRRKYIRNLGKSFRMIFGRITEKIFGSIRKLLGRSPGNNLGKVSVGVYW